MLTVVLIAAAWTVPSQWVYWLGLRELLRLGEVAGITLRPPAPGARLAGQVLGFNYAQPPFWYEFLTRTVASAAALSPAILASVWLHRRIRLARKTIPPSVPIAPIARATVSVAAAGMAFAAAEHLSGATLWRLFLGIGEAVGGQVIRLGGFGLTSGGGPFVGGGAADAIGNLLVRHGPFATLTGIAFAAAHLIDWLLWRGDVRRMRAHRLCPHCSYDLSGLASAAKCPECGKPSTERSPV